MCSYVAHLAQFLASTDKIVPLSLMAEEDFQWWKSAHNVLRGAPVTSTEPDTQLFTDASNIGRGAHWKALTVTGVWTTT